jgi:PII-like signaling protein
MSGTTYAIIEVYTREEVHRHGTPLSDAIVHFIAREKGKARCIVSRGTAGCFEDGEVATHHILDLSYNMPVKIEIVLPVTELGAILPRIEEMVTEGIVLVREAEMRVHHVAGDHAASHRHSPAESGPRTIE